MTEKLTLSGKTLSLGNRVNLGARSGVQIEVRKKRVITPEQKPATITTDAAQKLKLLQEAQKVAEHAKKLEEERQAKAEKERQLAEERAIKETKRLVEEQAKQAQSPSPKEEPHRTDFSKKKTRDDDEGSEVKFNAPHKSTFDQKRANKINMNAYRQYTPTDDEDDDENGGMQHRRRSLASIKRAKEKERQKFLNANKPVEKISREITVPEMISVQELANRMSEKGADVVKVLMKLGMMVTITQTIYADTAELVATELGHKVKRVAESDVENVLKHEEAREIGLRMAVGARSRDILRQFLIESVVLCISGGILGILLGHGMSLMIAGVLGWPIEASPQAIVAAVIVSATVGILFGFYPAWKASRLDPIEALRYE